MKGINTMKAKTIDRRKNYYLTIDTETANSLDDPLVYDIGGVIHDKQGNIYESFSFVIKEVFYGMQDLMTSSYYNRKLSMYYKQIENKERQVVTFYTARRHILALCAKYNVKAIIAHNMRFDYKSTATTQRYLTKSKYRYFLPYGIPLWDTLKMAQDTICRQKTYINYCVANGFMYENRPRATAEILYRYISGNKDFKEEHTGLSDVLIEKEIFAKCMRQHKKMRKCVW